MANKKHGDSRSKEYRCWVRIIHRCRNPEDKDFRNYGGRPNNPITVCERWLVYENFLEDAGRCPFPDHSIERIDNDKGYYKENCVWADRAAQALNRRSNRLLTHSGRTMTLTEWSELTGLNVKTLWVRLKRNWSVHDALTRRAA